MRPSRRKRSGGGFLRWAACLLLLAVAAARPDSESVPVPKSTELIPDPAGSLLFLASLDGSLTAVDRISGEVRWVSKDVPMIHVPTSSGDGGNGSKGPYFVPDPKSGELYAYMRNNEFKKLPFTIPQLVSMAPCKNSEGLMYTGRKLDFWIELNPLTGEKSEYAENGERPTCPKSVKEDEAACHQKDPLHPGKGGEGLVIGKTEYTISMAEGPGGRKWNITYHHYSSMDIKPQDYDWVHLTSPSSGTILTYDKEGGLLWEAELASPVVAVYSVDVSTSNLVSLPFNPIAPESLERFRGGRNGEMRALTATTYIGESNYGLYAVPAWVDESVPVLSGEGKATLPPLIAGPDGDNKGSKGQSHEKVTPTPSPVSSNESRGDDFILLGYYDVPEPTGKPPLMQIGQPQPLHPHPPIATPSQIHVNGNNESLELDPDLELDGQGEESLEFTNTVSVPRIHPDKAHPNNPFAQLQLQAKPRLFTPADSLNKKLKEVKPSKIVFTTAAITVGVTVATILFGFVIYRRYRKVKGGELAPLLMDNPSSSTTLSNRSRRSGKSRGSDDEGEDVFDWDEEVELPKKARLSADGTLSIGKISFSPSSVLGKGCEGTFVYKGKFEERAVAVKRILPECFAFADREVDLLKESDQHPNVIRYFCTETDGQFRYIALELCEATLSDWVEGRFSYEGLDPVQVLREATDGLAHLHSLRIVHRDIKPANVLLSVNGGGGRVRTMISDFGLCKKITNGRMSFSRRSGGIPGTEGWIAPEVLRNVGEGTSPSPSHRMSYSVDVFSLGCVFYFVLSRGGHPFGDPFRRQSNILSGDSELSKLDPELDPVGAASLISLMISPSPGKRPPLQEVLAHPLFWSKEKILAFFLDVSDRIEKEDESRCSLLRRLEDPTSALSVVRGDWRDHICPEVALDLRRYRTYKGGSVRDLLRALRNKKNHYRELTPEAQASLGHIPEQFTSYWLTRFPLLLPHSWLKFETVRVEPVFQKYYPKEFSFNWAITGEDVGLLDDEWEGAETLQVPEAGRGSPEKSPKIDKTFWRSKSQFKYNQWKRKHQAGANPPHNYTSFATTRYPPPPPPPAASGADADPSWRNPVGKDK